MFMGSISKKTHTSLSADTSTRIACIIRCSGCVLHLFPFMLSFTTEELIRIRRTSSPDQAKVLQNNMTFSCVLIEIPLTEFTLNIVGGHSGRRCSRHGSTRLDSMGNLTRFTDGSYECIVAFAPIVRLFLQRVLFRFDPFGVELECRE